MMMSCLLEEGGQEGVVGGGGVGVKRAPVPLRRRRLGEYGVFCLFTFLHGGGLGFLYVVVMGI